MSKIAAIGSMTAAQAVEVARRHGLVLVHEHRTGNYHYESTAAPKSLPVLLPVGDAEGAADGPTFPEAA